MEAPEFVDVSVADFRLYWQTLTKSINDFWAGDRSKQKFLILDFHRWDDLAVQDSQQLIELVVQNYQQLSFVQHSFGVGWVDAVENGCRVVSAIVEAP